MYSNTHYSCTWKETLPTVTKKLSNKSIKSRRIKGNRTFVIDSRKQLDNSFVSTLENNCFLGSLFYNTQFSENLSLFTGNRISFVYLQNYKPSILICFWFSALLVFMTIQALLKSYVLFRGRQYQEPYKRCRSSLFVSPVWSVLVLPDYELMTLAIIVSAHPYCARDFTCHVINRWAR